MAQHEDGRQKLEEEVRQVVGLVEEMTGLRSRWNGTVTVLDTATAAMLSREPYSAKKEWNCSITVLDSLVGQDRRWQAAKRRSLPGGAVRQTLTNSNTSTPKPPAT